MSSNWENKEPMGMRTKLALRVLMLMFKIISPYQFEHRFEKETADLQKLIDQIDQPTETKGKKS